MPLRKVNIRTSALGNNSSSFVNQTARRLHIRKIVMSQGTNAATAIGDISVASLDEIPVAQFRVNDSRSHIMGIQWSHDGGTGSLAGQSNRLVLSFNRGDLFLDADEALFLNTEDVNGAPPVNTSVQVWYED